MNVLNKVAKGFAILALTSMSLFAFSEGTDYVKLESPVPNADKTLIKVFSYDCPFCYKYDKAVTPGITKKLEGTLEFRPFHLKTKGKYGEMASKLFAVLLVKDQANGVKDLYGDKSLLKKAKMAYYNAYHDKRERWNDGEEAFLQTGLKASGITKEDFETSLKDQKVQDLLKEWDLAYPIAKVQGVPAFVVNGKYLIYTKNIKSPKGMLDLINELAKK